MKKLRPSQRRLLKRRCAASRRHRPNPTARRRGSDMIRFGIGAAVVAALVGLIYWHAYDQGYRARHGEIEAAIREANKLLAELDAEEAARGAREAEADVRAAAAMSKNASTIQSFMLDGETAAALNAQGVYE